MILVVLLSALSVAVASIVAARRRNADRAKLRHLRCLQNTARLERELGIGPWKQRRHGEREWFVDRYGPVDPKSEMARTLMARGLLYSAEYAAARQRLYPDQQQESV